MKPGVFDRIGQRSGFYFAKAKTGNKNKYLPAIYRLTTPFFSFMVAAGRSGPIFHDSQTDEIP